MDRSSADKGEDQQPDVPGFSGPPGVNSESQVRNGPHANVKSRKNKRANFLFVMKIY
jgi:hypothetical protein